MGLDSLVLILFSTSMSNLKPADLAGLRSANHLAVAGFGLVLRQAVGEDRHLRAHCACGRNGPVSTDYWMARGWGGRSLVGLIDYVRCTCGGRRLEMVVAIGRRWPGDSFYQLF